MATHSALPHLNHLIHGRRYICTTALLNEARRANHHRSYSISVVFKETKD